jgi:hypothetical protein
MYVYHSSSLHYIYGWFHHVLATGILDRAFGDSQSLDFRISDIFSLSLTAADSHFPSQAVFLCASSLQPKLPVSVADSTSAFPCLCSLWCELPAIACHFPDESLILCASSFACELLVNAVHFLLAQPFFKCHPLRCELLCCCCAPAILSVYMKVKCYETRGCMLQHKCTDPDLS